MVVLSTRPGAQAEPHERGRARSHAPTGAGGGGGGAGGQRDTVLQKQRDTVLGNS